MQVSPHYIQLSFVPTHHVFRGSLLKQPPALQSQGNKWKEYVYIYADKPLTGFQPLTEPTIECKSLILLTIKNIPLISSLRVYIFSSKALSFSIPFSVGLLSKIYFICICVYIERDTYVVPLIYPSVD